MQTRTGTSVPPPTTYPNGPEDWPNAWRLASRRPVISMSVTSQMLHAVAPLEPSAPPRVSVVIPCLNEAENIEDCVATAFAVLSEHDIHGEVIVADNGSNDGSPELAAA